VLNGVQYSRESSNDPRKIESQMRHMENVIAEARAADVETNYAASEGKDHSPGPGREMETPLKNSLLRDKNRST